MRWVKAAIGICAVLALIGCALLLLLAWHWGAVTPSPRVSTAEFATNRAVLAVVLNLEPVREEISRFAARASGAPAWLFNSILPYEGAVFADVDDDRAHRTIRLVVNPRRLGPLVPVLARRSSSPRPRGSLQWPVPAISWRDGVLRTHVAGPVSESTQAMVRERWPDAAGENIVIERGHLFEAVVDNRGGRGLVAMEGLAEAFEGRPVPEEPAAAPQELQRIFDAQQLSGLFYRASVVRVTADVADNEALVLKTVMECSDAQGASAMEFALLTVRDLLFAELIEHGVVLSGDPVQDGATVRMELRLAGWRTALARIIENAEQKKGGSAS